MLALLAKVIRLASVVICMILVLSFLVFAINQTKSASGHQREELGESSAAIHNGKSTQAKEGSARKALDEAFTELTSPFSGIVSSSSEWADRGVRLILGLLLYGFAFGFLARVIRVRV